MNKLLQGIVVVFSLSIACAHVHATEVALELQLMIDTSGSIDQMEFELQRNGYVQAFSDPTIQSSILALAADGGVAVSVSYFSTTATNVPTDGGVIAPNPQINWVQLMTQMDIDAFVGSLMGLQATDGDGDGGGTGQTNIGDAILFGVNSLQGNMYDGLRSVIDVSSDGIQNVTLAGGDIMCGFPPDQCSDIVVGQRNAAAALGITINGLAITTDEVLIEDYFNAFVRTADGFVIAASDFGDEFEDAITRKIAREISPIPIPAAFWLLGSSLLGLLGWSKTKKLQLNKRTDKV